MRAIFFYAVGSITVVLIAAGLSSGQTAAPKKQQTLMVKGYAGEVPVVQFNGKTYVQIESLARLTNGSISFHGNQITLAVSPPGADTSLAVAQPDTTEQPGFSKDFLRAGIDVLTVIREWRVALLNAIRNSSVSEDAVSGYARDAQSRLALVSAAVSKDADRNALMYFSNEFANMQNLSNKYLSLRQSMTYIPPDSLDNDKLDQQIQTCGRALASLVTSGQFQDIAVCH